MPLPVVTLARHGQTTWSLAGKHTGRTDLPLTMAGERAANQLGTRLTGFVGHVFTSPLQRASRTAALAGYPDAIIEPDLYEWDYGTHEGLTTAEIRATHADWELYRDGCPGGESPAEVIHRVDRLIAKLRDFDEDILLFSSGHLMRALAARWLGQSVEFGKFFRLDTGTVSELGYYHDRSECCVRLWNDRAHLLGD